MSNKYKKLGKNTLLMTLGNFGTKILTFLLLPFYTKYMSPEIYGKLDLITATISVLTPLLTLQFSTSVFRFVSENKKDEDKKIISTAMIFVLPILLIFTLLMSFVKKSYISEYYLLISLTFVLNFILGLLKEYIRGKQQITLYSLSGVLGSIINLVLNIVLVPKYGLSGFLTSGVISTLIVIIYLYIKNKFYKIIKISNYNKKYVKIFLTYSLPLIPNAIIWWVIGLSDRFIVNYYHGSELVGIYSVANQFSLLLTTVFGVFYSSLQISALEEYKDKDYTNFFNNIFNIVTSILIFCILGLTLIINPLMKIIVAKEFYTSWIYVIPLLLATLYNNYSAMLGVNYLVTKESKKLLKSSLIAAIVNIALNFILIPKYKLAGAILATVMSYLILFIIRYKDSYKLSKLELNKNFYIINLIPILMYGILISKLNIFTVYTLNFLLILLYLFIQKQKLKYVYVLLKSKIKKRSN